MPIRSNPELYNKLVKYHYRWLSLGQRSRNDFSLELEQALDRLIRAGNPSGAVQSRSDESIQLVEKTMEDIRNWHFQIQAGVS
jgi:hypothetical protein